MIAFLFRTLSLYSLTLSTVKVCAQLYVPVKVGPSITPIADYDIGRGYKLNVAGYENPIKNHVLQGEVESGPKTNLNDSSFIIKDKRGMKNMIDVDGSLALSINANKISIDATASGGYYEKSITTRKKIVIIRRIHYTAYFKKFKPGTLALTNDAKNSILSPEDFVARFGTKYVSEVVYGAQLEVIYTVESSEDIEDSELFVDTDGRINFNKLKVVFGANFNMTNYDSQELYSMSISVNAIGALITTPPNPTFDEVSKIIDDFDAEYQNKYNGHGEFMNDKKLLEQLEPIQFGLSETSSSVETKLNSMELDTLLSKMNKLHLEFYATIFSRAKLKQINEELRDQYETTPKMRVEMYTPYFEQFEIVLKNLDIKIHECLNYAAKPFKEIVSPNSPVPQRYPDKSTFDYKVFLGLQGDYCTPENEPVTIGNYEPLQGVKYCGFALQKDDGVKKKMIPWMSGKILFRGTEIARADTPKRLYQESIQYLKLPAGTLCNDDARIDDVKECERAGGTFGGCLGENESGFESIVIGEWHNAPKGCFIKSIADTSVIYLNKHEEGQGGKGEYSALCRRQKGGVYDTYTYTVVGTTNACPTGAALTKNECRQAGKKLGGRLSNPIEEHNNDTPTGCYQNLNDNTIHYNLNMFGRSQLGLTSICRKVPYRPGDFSMTRVSSKNDAVCQSTGQKNLDEDMCITAGLAFGGHLRNGELTEGNWTETPQGCFLNPSEDNAIHFNIRANASHVNGGDGRYSILCAKPVNATLF